MCLGCQGNGWELVYPACRERDQRGNRRQMTAILEDHRDASASKELQVIRDFCRWSGMILCMLCEGAQGLLKVQRYGPYSQNLFTEGSGSLGICPQLINPLINGAEAVLPSCTTSGGLFSYTGPVLEMAL